MWITFGVIPVVRFTKTGDQFLLWAGLIIGVGHLITLVFALLRSTKSEVELHEIVSAVFNNRNKNKYLDLNLKSKSKRRINKIDLISDELKSFLIENGIIVR